MPIQLYNTLSREKEVFEPSEPDLVSLYSCGPTVYWFAHIGNFRAFIFADTLRRVLEFNGYELNHVMNITDVGHLVGDGNEGEDKLEVGAEREGKTAWEIAEFYTDAFMLDFHRLNLERPSVFSKATDHIEEQIEMVKQLEKNGFTYKTTDGIYFDTSKLEDYGKLGGQAAEEKEAGARVEMGEKRNATDFALWKFSPEGKKRHMEWDSPWGTGFPGWHIECSAMSTKYLGPQFDIHTGGIDHIAVHHENELAQTKGALGTLQANVWMHNAFITVDGGRMGKSLGNAYTLNDLTDRGFHPLAFRYFVLGGHYRSTLNFTWEALAAAQHALDRLWNTIRGWEAPSEPDSEYLETFTAYVNDDLDTPKALALVWKLVEDTELDPAVRSATLLAFDEVLGLTVDESLGIPFKPEKEAKQLVRKRNAARRNKQWEKSDQLRDQLEALGYEVLDGESGTELKPKRILNI